MGAENTKELELEKEEEKTVHDKQEEVKEEQKTAIRKTAIKTNLNDFVELLRTIVTRDEKYWRLVYRLSTAEHIGNFMFDFEKAEAQFSGCCAQLKYSNKDDVYRCLAETMVDNYYKSNPNGFAYYRMFNTLSLDNPKVMLAKRCDACTDNSLIPACPYRVNALILFTCGKNNINAEEVYARLQGKLYKKLDSLRMPATLVELKPEEYEFLDMMAVFAAVIMLKEKFITYETGIMHFTYTYADLLKSKAKSNLKQILDIYDGIGEKVKLSPTEFKAHVTEKMVGSHILFRQYPERVAAYIGYLASKHHANAVETALTVLKKVCNSKYDIRNNFYMQLYRDRLLYLPLNEESRKLAFRIFDYSINHYFNSSIPFMPINMVIYSDDEQETRALIDVFKWVTRFFAYFRKDYYSMYYREVSLVDTNPDYLTKVIYSLSADSKEENSKTPMFLHIKDFDLFPEMEQRAGDNLLAITKLQHAIEEKQNELCVVISGEREKLEGVLEKYTEFYNVVMDRHFVLGDMNVGQMVFEIISRLEVDFSLEDGFEKVLREYVTLAHQESKLKSKAFIDKVIRDITFSHFDKDINTKTLLCKDIPRTEGKKSDGEIWEEINSLEGLQNIKDEMKKLQNLLNFRRKTVGRGINLSEKPNLHMVFKGNPGTGKTTVARMLGSLLYSFGYLRENKLIETSPKDLIAQWVGQTAPKTAQVCQSAYGGILFIDEAYELASEGMNGAQAGYRNECITELIKQMEDHRDNLVVIFAGYSNDMEKLLKSNAGLESRIGNILVFQDYSEKELMSMYQKMMDKSGFYLEEPAKELVKERIKDAKTIEDFGNGRYIRNLFEKTVAQHASNTYDVDDEKELCTITVSDIPDVDTSRRANRKNRIGF